MNQPPDKGAPSLRPWQAAPQCRTQVFMHTCGPDDKALFSLFVPCPSLVKPSFRMHGWWARNAVRPFSSRQCENSVRLKQINFCDNSQYTCSFYSWHNSLKRSTTRIVHNPFVVMFLSPQVHIQCERESSHSPTNG